jgi:NitT/TauT family transport system substrate-binding protein
MAEANIPYTDIAITNLNSEEVGSSFVSGSIDAGVTWEPWLSNAQKRRDAKVLVTTKDRPGIITDVVIARNDFVLSRRDDAKKFIIGIF